MRFISFDWLTVFIAEHSTILPKGEGREDVFGGSKYLSSVSNQFSVGVAELS